MQRSVQACGLKTLGQQQSETACRSRESSSTNQDKPFTHTAGAFIFEDVGVTAYKVNILACRTTNSTAQSKPNWHVMRVQSGRPLHTEAMRLGNSTLCRAHQPLALCNAGCRRAHHQQGLLDCRGRHPGS